MEQKANKKLNNKSTGSLGEQLAAQYLVKQGFRLLEMNYLRKWGEIDVIVKKNEKVHFFEVKTVSYETKAYLESAVTHGTWRPEENVHEYKLKKLSRAIETWLSENKWTGEIQIDVAAVRVVPRETYSTINIISNVIIE